ncbi:MAG: hypothetical protein QME65_05250, partial [Candidatus Omnitrophota bacterium]|nr:hypothetical protein [Candidatus Omnitrophota bacterium]
LIRPAGYYNVKAKRIKNFLKFLIATYGGDLKQMRRKGRAGLRRQLLGINGIGPETADSILLYALEKPVFVVDAYTRRIFSRHRFIDPGADYQQLQELFMQGLKKDVKLFNEYHALLVRLGKEFCSKNKPKCSLCPLKERRSMRNLLLAFAFVFCLASASYAAPCYGTKMPGRNKFFAGVQYHNIFKRYLERGENGKMKSQQEFILLSYGVFDWLSIDLKGGAGDIKQKPLEVGQRNYAEFLGGGYGFRLRLYEKERIKAVFGFQHISIHPKTIHLSDGKHKAVLDDWQLSALASYGFKKVTPYLGARWSREDYIHWLDGERSRVKSDLDRSFGFIYGCDIPLTQKLWINLEGQTFDSEAFAFSINYSF